MEIHYTEICLNKTKMDKQGPVNRAKRPKTEAAGEFTIPKNSWDGGSVGGHPTLPNTPYCRDSGNDPQNSTRDSSLYGKPTHDNSMQSMDSVDDGQQEIIYTCEEINKRSLGKAIIRFCGNEGAVNDDNKKSLRRLVQEAISHVEKESPEIWRNAEIKIYDDNCDIYVIKSGEGKHFFLATFDGMGKPQIVKTKKSKIESTTNKNCNLM